LNPYQEYNFDPDLVKFARLAYRMGFCKNIICPLLGMSYELFDRIMRDCKQGDKEYLIDEVEV